jgi:Family of unknown function (DUF6256)
MSSSLIRQDLLPMVIGYLLIMGALAVGLRLARRSARAEAAAATVVTDPGRPVGQPNPAPVSAPAASPVPAPVSASAAAPVGRATARKTGPAAGRVTARARLRAIVSPGPGWRRLVIHCLGTAVGGYLLLMAVIIGYYYGVAPIAGNFVESAFSGCAMLIGLAAPVWIALSWLTERKGWRL